jgi:hypothetical protein
MLFCGRREKQTPNLYREPLRPVHRDCDTYRLIIKIQPKIRGLFAFGRLFHLHILWARRDSNPRLLLCDSSVSVFLLLVSCVSYV